MSMLDIFRRQGGGTILRAEVLTSAHFEGGSGATAQDPVAISPMKPGTLPAVMQSLAGLAPANLPAAGQLAHARNVLVDMLQTAYLERCYGPMNVRWRYGGKKLLAPQREMRQIILDGRPQAVFFDHSAIPNAA